jgi:hypothetical protein
MTIAEQQLAQIGFGRGRAVPGCWRVVRLDPSLPVRAAAEPVGPACSRDLQRWRDLLGGDPNPPPYRIARA